MMRHETISISVNQFIRFGLLTHFVVCLSISNAQVPGDFETDSITSNTIVASSFINNSKGWLADEAGVIWYTANAGGSWSSIATGKYFVKMDFTDASVGYAITDSTVHKTTNGGSSWSTLTMPEAIAGAVCFVTSSIGFVSSDGVVYKTTNGGSSWSTISTPGVSFTDYYFVSSSLGIAVAEDDSSKCIWRTTNGGTSWSNVFSEENYFISSVWFINDSVGFATGYYSQMGRGKLPVILRSTDEGLTWEQVYMNRDPGDIKGEELIAIRFKNELEGIALSTFSENVITNDGGETWELAYADEGDLFPSFGIYKTLDGSTTLFLAGKNGYVTKWE